ncbi:MAG TPA: TIGR00730 family Rossman fold protein [Anaerolineales bacterium]|nr:TIGR00730 family Rossman fold protein [Anaerolineales bacterium]
MKSICVYCGSANRASRKYFESARRMGETLSRRGLALVYGGGRTGLMGALADAVLAGGGQAFGVITQGMNTPELAHTGLTRLEVTATIHQRKARMYELADGYLALPGGYGTLDELFETLTWAQIGEHNKPVGLLNVDGYYDPLLAMLDRAVEEKFLFPEHRQALLCAAGPDELLELMQAYRHPGEAVRRWMTQE